MKFRHLSRIENFLVAKILKNKKNTAILKKKIKKYFSEKILVERCAVLFHDELFFLRKEGSCVGSIIQKIKGNKIVVEINTNGKFVVNFSSKIDKKLLYNSSRVALRNDSYLIHKILSSGLNSLLSHTKVDNVSDSNYEIIGGLDFQIEQLKEVIELPIKFPEIFQILGVSQPKGVLLYGPPGTGKTLLARSVAYHSECTFIKINGSELVQKYIGEGSKMIRDIFKIAELHSPSIIFMDEIDSIGSNRVIENKIGGDLEVQRTMLELLNQLDGFDNGKKIKILMATNRIDVLDSALIRPGRIDRKIKIPNPNTEGRLCIFKIHLKKTKVQSGIDIWELSRVLRGVSGADIKLICTEAGIFAIKNRRNLITKDDFRQAIVKIKIHITANYDRLRFFFKK